VLFEKRAGFSVALSSVSTAALPLLQYHLSVIVLAFEYYMHIVLSFILLEFVKRSFIY